MICEPASGAKQGLILPDTKAQRPPKRRHGSCQHKPTAHRSPHPVEVAMMTRGQHRRGMIRSPFRRRSCRPQA
jgi:hypothetical protein